MRACQLGSSEAKAARLELDVQEKTAEASEYRQKMQLAESTMRSRSRNDEASALQAPSDMPSHANLVSCGSQTSIASRCQTNADVADGIVTPFRPFFYLRTSVDALFCLLAARSGTCKPK